MRALLKKKKKNSYSSKAVQQSGGKKDRWLGRVGVQVNQSKPSKVPANHISHAKPHAEVPTNNDWRLVRGQDTNGNKTRRIQVCKLNSFIVLKGFMMALRFERLFVSRSMALILDAAATLNYSQNYLLPFFCRKIHPLLLFPLILFYYSSTLLLVYNCYQ